MGNNRTKALPTVEINGSKYSKIAERIKFLANEHQYSITTDVEFLHELNSWKAKAVLTIQENDDVFTYTGHAIEEIGSNDINSTSALENDETTAVGRACAFAGIGLTDEVASAEEVAGAKEKFKEINNQARKQTAKSAETNALKKLTENGSKK